MSARTLQALPHRTVLFIVIIAGTVILSSCGRSSELDPKVIERSKQIPILKYGALSSEKTHPHPNNSGGRYTEAIVSYPDVRDCLVGSERDLKKPDLRLIDWPQFNTRYEVEVCLWRIFNSINDVELTKEWMEFYGLRVREKVPPLEPRENLHYTSKLNYTLTGGYLIKRGKPRLVPYKQSVGIIKIRWAQKINVAWNDDKTKIVKVSFQTTVT